MQTFLPYPSFAGSAAVLDDRRLGKQRVETLQVLRALHLEGYGWQPHPVVRMWRGRTRALVAYGLAVVDEWRRRGGGDTTGAPIAEFAAPRPAVSQGELEPGERPPWLGSKAFHRSHRSALVRKDPAYYARRFPGTPPGLPYVWPEAPGPPESAGPVSAWVLRPASSEERARLVASGVVALPASHASPSASRKQRRQLATFLEALRPGERVALLDGGGHLLVGVVTGPPVHDAAGGMAATRPVRWGGTTSRHELRRPYQLQNPLALFPLRGEPVLAGSSARPSDHAGPGSRG